MTKPHRPPAFIFDIGGTLAIRNEGDPREWGVVNTDPSSRAVVDVAQVLDRAGHQVLKVSGWPDNVRNASELWLHEHAGADTVRVSESRPQVAICTAMRVRNT